jgi:hypothetical protein
MKKSNVASPFDVRSLSKEEGGGNKGVREHFFGRSGAIKTPDPFTLARKQELCILCGSV